MLQGLLGIFSGLITPVQTAVNTRLGRSIGSPLRASLVSFANLRGIAKAEIKVSLEIKDSPKTALDATVVFLYHFQ